MIKRNVICPPYIHICMRAREKMKRKREPSGPRYFPAFYLFTVPPRGQRGTFAWKFFPTLPWKDDVWQIHYPISRQKKIKVFTQGRKLWMKVEEGKKRGLSCLTEFPDNKYARLFHPTFFHQLLRMSFLIILPLALSFIKFYLGLEQNGLYIYLRDSRVSLSTSMYASWQENQWSRVCENFFPRMMRKYQI